VQKVDLKNSTAELIAFLSLLKASKQIDGHFGMFLQRNSTLSVDHKNYLIAFRSPLIDLKEKEQISALSQNDYSFATCPEAGSEGAS
jgi:hypothetical protein